MLEQTPDWLQSIKLIAEQDLKPQVIAIDQEGLYPERILRSLGTNRAFSQHLPIDGRSYSVWNAILAMESISEACLSTGFCMWCQNALGWYIWASENTQLKSDLGSRIADGSVLGGTALSNPMKHFFGIEPLHLKAERCKGGYSVSGSLPWVSNLGNDHYFAAVFEVRNQPGNFVMAVVACDAPGLELGHDCQFVALNGTRTCSIRMKNVFVPHESVLADPIGSYLKRIRSGFILLQTGMALGLIKNLTELMRQMRKTHAHINCYLPDQPENIEAELLSLRSTVSSLAETPFEGDIEYFRAVIKARLTASELSLRAAHAAMLHEGARGYRSQGLSQRRLREAYFVALVTPAIKQLRKMLHDINSRQRADNKLE